MRTTPVARAVALGAVVAVLAACGTGGDSSSDSSSTSGSSGPVTITWWHNSNTDPGKAYYDKVAKDFQASHPGVTIQVSAMQHEDMLTKLDAAFQSGDAPDVYMERGGGELADHVKAGLTKDLSEPAKDVIDKLGGSVAGFQVDGKTYALPFSLGVVGFWYNKSLFEKAGITNPPTSVDELAATVAKLKAAGMEPLSVGAGDKWPAAHYWYYLALRECPEQVLKDAVKSLDFSNQCFIKAGEDLQKGFAERDMGLPTNPAATGSVKDPALGGLLKVRDEAPYVQLYFDTAFGQSVGGAMNDEIALMFAGKATPQDIVDKTQQAADAEK